MSKADTLRVLKQQLQQYLSLASTEAWSYSRLTYGVPRGALVELSGPKRSEWALQFLREHPELKVCWIEKTLSLLPTAVAQREAGLDRFLFVEAGDDLFTPMRKALRSRAFDIVASPNAFESDRTLKALQLLTEQSQSTCLLFASQASSAWPIAVQVECLLDGQTRILKHKKIPG